MTFSQHELYQDLITIRQYLLRFLSKYFNFHFAGLFQKGIKNWETNTSRKTKNY